MKKKLVSLLLTATMVMGVLSGCGNGKTSVSQTGDTSTDEKVEMAAADDVDGTTITFWHSMGGVNGQAIDTLVNKFNEELTDANKIKIVQKREKAAFGDVYDAYSRTISKKIYQKVWDEIKAGHVNDIGTDSFFSVYQEYCGEQI